MKKMLILLLTAMVLLTGGCLAQSGTARMEAMKSGKPRSSI